jgi:tetratricopeptide (TPR) repeat protein/uncharacterized caspase-like protein
MLTKHGVGYILAVSVFFLPFFTTSCVPSSVHSSKGHYRPPAVADAFSQGKIRYESGDYASALTFFLKATKEDPANWLPYNWLAWTYYNLKRYEEAIVQFNISNNLKESASNYQGLGESYSMLDNYDAALANYQKYAKLEPKNFYPYNRLGWTYFNLKRYDDAIVQFNIANNLKQVSGNYQGLGESYAGKGDFNTALVHFQKYADLEPKNFYPFNRIGWSYFNLQRYHEAIVQFNIANTLKQASGNYQGLGESYSKLGNFAMALENYQKYADMEPNNFYPLNRLGWTYINMKKYRDAIDQFKNSNRLKKASPNYMGLAESYVHLEEYENADAAFDGALKTAQNDFEKEQAKISWVNCLVTQGKYQKAYELLGPKPYVGMSITREPDGIKILHVVKGSPADVAGLQAGDILTQFDGHDLVGVETRIFLQEILAKATFNSRVTVMVKRGGQQLAKYVSIGINPSGTRADRARVQTPALAQADTPKTGAHWAVIIGISNYRDTRIPSLRYASSDAKAFYDWIISPEGGRYAPARIKLLLDDDATGENIKKALFEWLRGALAEDMVVIYYAGHGSPESPDSPSNLFLLPYDTRYDSIATTGFPMWDIETALKRYIKAKKVVVIADACHAGGVGQSFDISRRANRGVKVNPISSGIQNLAQVSEGVCIISASNDNQFSQESEKWGGGRGVFTHFLIEGLKGKADYNKNYSVSLGELTSYLSEQVRRETRNAQSPTVSGRYDPALAIGK